MKNLPIQRIFGMALVITIGLWSNQICAQDLRTGKFYQIIAKHSGKALDVKASKKGNGIDIHQWDAHGGDNQLFQIRETCDGYYQIVAKHSGKVVDVEGGPHAKGDGTNVHQWEYVKAPNQQWQILEKGNGYFQIIAKHSGKALDIYGSNDRNGAKLVQYESTGNDNQLFMFVEEGEKVDGVASLGEEY